MIFTNGTFAMAEAAAQHAGLTDLIEGIVTVDTIRKFKTVPETYALVAETLGLNLADIALVSSNRWDVAGAISAGMEAIWCNRAAMPDEYGDLPPTRVIGGLGELVG